MSDLTQTDLLQTDLQQKGFFIKIIKINYKND